MSYRYVDLSSSEVFELLRQMRENNERKSEDVLYLAELVHNDIQKLGSEKFIILEQIIIAALDTHCYSLAVTRLSQLNGEFPGSLRVLKLKAACLEANEEYEEALEVLESIIKLDETNAPARKRRVAILKAQGHITDAIKELVDYLKKFMSDMEAWQELSELYLQVSEYSKAAFCLEELILHQPHNNLLHQRLADIRYTMGGAENMELAKSYYCQALKLNPENMRALLGLFLVTNNLMTQYKSSGSIRRKEVWKLAQWVQSRLAAAQAQARAPPALSEMMLTLAICD